jgi:hypothetical protein
MYNFQAMVKAAFPALVLLLASVFPGISQISQPEINTNPDSLYNAADAILLDSFYPRLEASDGEKALFQHLEKKLSGLDISYSTMDFADTETFHSFSSSLEVTIAGEKADTLIVCVPLDHPEGQSGELSGTVNIILALRWLEHARKSKLPLSLKMLFLGAEHGEEDDYPMGSRLFLENFYPEFPLIILYLNMKKIPSRIIIREAGDKIVSPEWLTAGSIKALKTNDISFRTSGVENQLYRMGLKKEQPIIDPYLRAGYPALALEGEYDPVSDEEGEAWFAAMDLFFRHFMESFKEGIPVSWDRHYLLFQIRSFFLILPEFVYLILLAVVMGLSILAVQLFYKRFLVYLKWVIKNSWFLLIIFGICFIFFFCASISIEGIMKLRNNQELWKDQILLFTIFKFSFFGLFWMLITPLRRRLPYTRNKKFYSSSALLFLFLDMIILSIFNISFSYYFLWAYFFILLFILFRNRFLKLLFLILAPLWLVIVSIDLFINSELEFFRIVLLSRYYGNLLLSVFLLPFILLLVKLPMLFPPSGLRRLLVRRVGIVLSALSLAGLFTYALIFSPYSSENPQEISVVNTIEADRKKNSIEFTGEASLGSISLWDEEGVHRLYTNDKRLTLNREEIPRLLTVESMSSRILDRNNLQLLFNSAGRPYRMSFLLSSEQDFILFDANFPFVREVDRESPRVTYRLLVGKHPPNPFPLILTLPDGNRYNLSVRIIYREPPFIFRLYGKDKKFSTEVIYHLDMPL